MILAHLATAFAADEPCYGHAGANRVSGSQFWVEWDGDFLDEPTAQAIVDSAEHARDVYRDQLGFPFTTEAIVIHAVEDGTVGVSGLTQTTDCAGIDVPTIRLGIGNSTTASMTNVTGHEVAHAAEYAYMGDYIDSVNSWLWWMEGCATWMDTYADGDLGPWSDAADKYLNHPELALHHGLEGFTDPVTSDQMYGTGFLAAFLDDNYGGMDTVRATWEYGGTVTGTPIFFPDAIAASNLDFDEVWAHYLAVIPTLDVQRRERLAATPARMEDVTRLPASGETDQLNAPEGLGMGIVRFAAAAGEKKSALQVTFDGDPAVPWHVVLVRTNGTAVVDYVPIPVDATGHGEGWVPGFYRLDAYLVASPHSIEATPYAFSWDASLVEDKDAMAGTVTLSEAPDVKKGCSTAPHPAGLLGIAAALAFIRRRRAS